MVLNQGQRVFLDRYLDVAKKFLFDTYEVSNSEEVKKAIEKNGDFKVEFYKERVVPRFNPNYGNITMNNSNVIGGINASTNINSVNLTNTSGHIGTTALYSSSIDQDFFIPVRDESAPTNSIRSLKSRSKSIETGRVEQGSVSDQKVVTVDKKFEYWAFHTIEYKMLPVSQKINTVEDINVKVYCTNCGAKLGKGQKFCGQCGTKA